MFQLETNTYNYKAQKISYYIAINNQLMKSNTKYNIPDST